MFDNNFYGDNEINDSEFDNSKSQSENYSEENHDFLLSECNTFTPSNDNRNKKGIAVFFCLIAAALLLISASALGYFAGKNASKSNTGDITLNLASKPTDTDAYSAEQVYEAVNKSVVGIAVYNSDGIHGYASGVVYSEDGYIITNDHIYEDVEGAKFKIYTYDGSTYNAEYIAGDTRSDLALLKINSSGFYPATFGNSDELKYGEQVVAIGRPSDATASSSITGGYISFLNRRVSNSTSYASRLIQTDCAINPGSSGGALVNMYGQVIGITSSKLVGDEYEGVGYAIPTSVVKYIVDELINNGTVTTRAKLGVTYKEISEITAEINNSDVYGLLIASVSEESSLYGKVSANDIITAVNGEIINNGDIILDIIESSKPGDNLELTVYFSSTGVSKNITAELVQAESTSSYSSKLTSGDKPAENNGGTFDFPYGY